ncbi:class I SAM-dependent methyltransferase [Brevibacillus sp. 179-C9.3 HS]|uniref:class I SAM-dependent methyltransferase n=1 Tax=unclassified Brevibacillus TaxID=2684853 RepID=UPI0039A1A16B
MVQTNQWNAGLYDAKMNFVSEYGKGLMDWLHPDAGESILDLGCGTGDLCAQLTLAGANVTGIDFSADMIEAARQKYPQLAFAVADAHTFRTEVRYDAVFSNAALHWMKRPAEVIETIWLALAPGGRFVAEFGGKGNCGQITQALRTVLERKDISADERSPWYFPSIGEYTTLLEKQGFHVVLASHFDRPTTMADGDRGLSHWLNSFCSPFFAGLSSDEIQQVCNDVTDLLRPSLFQDGRWVLDYKRIRVVALKKTDRDDSLGGSTP